MQISSPRYRNDVPDKVGLHREGFGRVHLQFWVTGSAHVDTSGSIVVSLNTVGHAFGPSGVIRACVSETAFVQFRQFP
jgi:hypothetical protein